MLNARIAAVVLSALVFGLPGFCAGGENSISYKIQGYHENNLTTVLTNLLGFGLGIGEKWRLEGGAMVDAITAASRSNIHGTSPGPNGVTSATRDVDGITSASETDEFRKAASGSLSFTHDFIRRFRTDKNNDDPTTLSVFGSYSTERDYLSRNIGGSVSQDLFQRNTTVAVRFGRNYDQYFPDSAFIPEKDTDEGWEYLRGEEEPAGQEDGLAERLPLKLTYAGEGKRLTDRVTISLTQGLTTTTVFSPFLEFAYDRGYLARPYYTYRIKDELVQETLPPTRRMLNGGVRLNQFVRILSGVSLRGGYRYYTDSWEMQSHTVSIEVNIRPYPTITVSPSYRFYNQTHAFFYKDIYHQKPRYLTTDFKHGPLNTHTIGLKLRLETNRGAGALGNSSALYPESFDIAGNYLMRSSVTDVTVRNSHYEVWPIDRGFRAFWIQAGISLSF